MSYRSVESDDNTLKWADEYVKDSDIEAESISDDSQDQGSEKEGPSRSLRSKSIFHNWEPELIWEDLQTLPGVDNDFIEAIKDDRLNEILQNPNALSSGLLIATYLGNATIVASLLNLGASVDQVAPDGRTALHIAANCDNLECLQVLIKHKSDVNKFDANHKVTALHLAASKGSLACLEELIISGADINAGIKTPLHYAVENLEEDCVKALLESGASPNTIQVFSETPLHVAATLGSAEILKLLIQHGASVNVQCGSDKTTALHLAAEDGNIECVRLLIEARANISALNGKKQTPLHIAAFCQSSEAVELLLKKDANPNASDKDGRTPLHSAIVKVSRSSECVKLLLGAGANVNKPDAFGYTPLHLAALNEFSTCVMMLINAGGDVTVRTNGGISVLTFITRRTPDVIPKYICKFDNSIKLTDHEIGDVDCELKLDFKILVPSTSKGETELLLNFIEVGHREVLNHPLCETFLYLKWRRIRKYFLFSLFYHAVYVTLFTAYTIEVFSRDCESKLNFAMTFRGGPGIHRKPNTCLVPEWAKNMCYLLIMLNFMLVGKEIFQIAHSWATYIKQWENWLQWMIIIAVFLCAVPTNGDITFTMYSWQHHVAAIGIFLTWLELMMIVGRFPIFGLYIQMFTTVAINFAKFLLAYGCLLIAFGLSFGVLFANYRDINNIFLWIMKTIIMMSGELEFEDMFYTKEYPVHYPGTAHVMYLAFVLLVTVILTNLMVGLAVSDIQGLQQSAGLDRLVRQAELVAHLESMLFSRLLRWMPSKFLAFFYKHALLLKSTHHSALYIRPNDPRENRIPKDLIKHVYELVCERKERIKRKRSCKVENYQIVSRLNSTSDYTYMGKSNKLNVEYNNMQYV